MITNYYDVSSTVKKHKKSSQAKPYESPTYKQNDLKTYYKISKLLIEPTKENTIPEEFPPPRIEHRKFKNSRITSYFKCKPD